MQQNSQSLTLADVREKLMNSSLLQSPKARALLSAVWSALTWGTWAFIANFVSLKTALVAGFSQASVSFVTTLIGSILLELLFVSLGGSTLAITMSVAIVSSISLTSMLWVHLSNETPNVILTILPIYIVVVSYCYFYLLGLRNLANARKEGSLTSQP